MESNENLKNVKKIRTLVCAATGTMCHQCEFEAHRSAMCGRCDAVLDDDEVLLKPLPLN